MTHSTRGTHSDTWFNSAAQWNEAREYASGKLDSPVQIDESAAPENFIQLFYNDSDKPKTFALSEEAYVDPRGKPCWIEDNQFENNKEVS
ncbi:MAG: hypothetical protein GY790_03270 [Bacteroidetes bacterium]|nr:hypothetical protein [Bacteroidota bacterium]